MIWATIKDIFVVLFGKDWLWGSCGMCGKLIWMYKKKTHSVKFRAKDNEYAWVTLPLCHQCSFDFARMENDAKYVRRTKGNCS